MLLWLILPFYDFAVFDLSPLTVFINCSSVKQLYVCMRGKLYSSSVRSSMLHGCETWPVRKENDIEVKDRVPSRVERETRNR